MNGFGRYKMSNGRAYEGNWKDGAMHGEGQFQWEDGRLYIGKYN